MTEDMPTLSVGALQRHDGWQRSLRQVVGVSLRGLGHPSDLFMELRPLLTCVTVEAALSARSGRVSVALAVQSEGPPGSDPADPPLYRSETALDTANPTWPLSPETLPPLAGALRAVRITVRRRSLVGGEGPVLWDRAVFFEQLAHVVTELAPPLLLPAGTLLLEFGDG